MKLESHDLNGAWDLIHAALERNPDSPELSSTLGLIDYFRGEMGDAETEFKRAIHLNEKFAPAWVGLGRVFEAGSLRAKAKVWYQKAWHENPNDPEVQRYYARTLAPAEKLAALERYLSAIEARNQNADSETTDAVRRQIEELKFAENRKLFAVAPVGHAVIKLSRLMHDAKRIRGFGLPVSINGSKTLNLLMDTGASGILLNRKAADAAGLHKISDVKFWGIGDEGDRTGQLAFADHVRVGDVSIANCPIEISDRKTLTDEDGLIGPSIFSQYRVSIDFQKLVLTLDPLPSHKVAAADEAWDDREVAPEFSTYSQFWSVGHHILLPTKVNDSKAVLFLIDTGSSTSLIDPDYARRFKSLRSEDLVTVKGISGKTSKVQSSGYTTFEFGHYRQPVPGILAVPLTKIARDSPQFTGIFGMTTLADFRLQINYRDGLLNLEYVGPKY